MMEWAYDRAAWEASLWAVGYGTRQAGRELSGLADAKGFVSVPTRNSMRGHVAVLRDLGLIELLPRGRARLTMNAGPVRAEAA